MLSNLILAAANEWFNGPDCQIKPLLTYIREVGYLREPQIQAIEIYLFLKIACQNETLVSILEGTGLISDDDLGELHLSSRARKHFENDRAASTLLKLSRKKLPGSEPIFPAQFEAYLRDNYDNVDAADILNRIFYGVPYPDYLFSLPMGAGKTFLMAAFIYLDLYFAMNEPDNKAFAHNFIVLAPSGLKSSIIPSLKTIEHFDPKWVLPEPAASQIKKMITFEVLDEAKSAKKSNRARNPNAQKINTHQPFDDCKGLVLVTNAEKVILDRVELDSTGHLFERSKDEKDKAANELRHIIGKLPNLLILIDEVHHATKDDIKLRQVVSGWNQTGNVTGVLGFSGTPYLSGKEKIEVGQMNLRFSQIANTVFYYPLTRAVRTFLKKPTVTSISGASSLSIVGQGVREFFNKFGSLKYGDGSATKLAIYCGSIERLEDEVFPYLTNELKIPPEQILKYHRGNKRYKITKGQEFEFENLKTPLSNIRIILLVQIGKEGWDLKSLTGVILSQQGDCPTNMVLQTSCRCLRQVDKGHFEEAGIWLNEYNAAVLDKQLKEEQNTSIAEINKIAKNGEEEYIRRYSRLEYLRLPKVKFWQLKVQYDILVVEDEPNPKKRLGEIKLEDYSRTRQVTRGTIEKLSDSKKVEAAERGEKADFNRWIFSIAKGGFQGISLHQLKELKPNLQGLFESITVVENGERYFNELINDTAIASEIRLAFAQKRTLHSISEVIPTEAELLVVEKLAPIEKLRRLFPSESDTKSILTMDSDKRTADEERESRRKLIELAAQQGMEHLLSIDAELSNAIVNKDRSFQYIPYDFTQSRFELQFLEQAFQLVDIRDRELELYYNGERALTEFQVRCYEKLSRGWKYIGRYTPDFLLIQRKNSEIHKALVIETKGSGFSEQTGFSKRRIFMQGEWLKINNQMAGYNRFDYLYLSDSDEMKSNIAKLSSAIARLFA